MSPSANTTGFFFPFANGVPYTMHRVDQGQDMSAAPNTAVLAAGSGHIEYRSDPNGFGDQYPVLILDNPVGGHTGVYYGHIAGDLPAGTHVNAGQQLGHTLQTPGGNATEPGWLEIGFWGPSGPTGDGAAMASMLSSATAGPAPPPIAGQASAQNNTPTATSGPLSYADLEGLWIAAGGDPAQAPLMASIALAESSGHPTSLNATDNGGTQSSYGLWQISTGTHAAPDPNWSDPLTNARLAVAKFKSQGLGAWGTYTSGAYRRFSQTGVAPSTFSGVGGGSATGQSSATSSASASPPPPFDPKNPPPVAAALIDKVMQNYPMMAWAINDPELGPILRYAGQYGMNDAWVQSQISQTNWYKTNSASQRAWKERQQTDPAEALQEMHNQAATIQAQAARMGLTIGPDRANQIAQDALAFSWNPDQINHALYAEAQSLAAHGNKPFGETSMGQGGQAQTYALQAKQMARQYLTTLDDATATDYGFKIASGQMDQSALQSLFVGQARARFKDNPDLMKALDAGITPGQVLSPYQQQIAGLLEISPDQVDFTNPRYAPILSTTDERGTNRLMTETEAQQWARSQPEWSYTKNANDSMAQAAMQVASEMGSARF